MKHKFIVLALGLGLVGCTEMAGPNQRETGVGQNPDTNIARPVPRPTDAAVPPNARTAEEFDTTSAQERQAAQTVTAGGESLGSTIATLGSPAEPGFWMETPLVDSVIPGRVSYEANGKSVEVELRPIDGPATAGSRLSLAAIRLLEAPLTGLLELTVHAK